MRICKKGNITHLRGDLILSGVTRNIVNSMAVSLQKITAERGNKILIDCSGVRIADLSGLQLLYVWMQCASLWGVESELVNLPDRLQQTIHTLGVEHCFGGTA